MIELGQHYEKSNLQEFADLHVQKHLFPLITFILCLWAGNYQAVQDSRLSSFVLKSTKQQWVEWCPRPWTALEQWYNPIMKINFTWLGMRESPLVQHSPGLYQRSTLKVNIHWKQDWRAFSQHCKNVLGQSFSNYTWWQFTNAKAEYFRWTIRRSSFTRQECKITAQSAWWITLQIEAAQHNTKFVDFQKPSLKWHNAKFQASKRLKPQELGLL